MYIKIYTKSQLVLLRSVNVLFEEKYKIPADILNKVNRVFKERRIGKNGFIAILLEPVEDDFEGIKDVLNCYPQKLKIGDDIEAVSVTEKHTWMTKGKEWYMDTMKIKGEESWVYAIYSMTLESIYG